MSATKIRVVVQSRFQAVGAGRVSVRLYMHAIGVDGKLFATLSTERVLTAKRPRLRAPAA